MDTIKLKAELFEIRRRIDILDQQRAQLIQLYNEKLRRLNEEESESKNESKGDSAGQERQNKIISRIPANSR